MPGPSDCISNDDIEVNDAKDGIWMQIDLGSKMNVIGVVTQSRYAALPLAVLREDRSSWVFCFSCADTPPLLPSSTSSSGAVFHNPGTIKWFIFIGPKWQQCCDTLCCRYEAAGRWRRTMAQAIQWECWPCAQCSCVSRIDYTVPLCEDHRKRGQQLCIHAGGSPRASTATGTWKDACVLE